MNKIEKIFVGLLIFLFWGCQPAWRQLGGFGLDYDRSGNHFIILDKHDIIDSLGRKGCIMKFYNLNSKIDSVYIGTEETVIDKLVNEVQFDDNFILVDQKPMDSICECVYECGMKKYKDWNTRPTLKICQAAIKKSTFHQYWIIDKIKNSVFGPFTFNDYLIMKNRLRIDKKLKLEREKYN